MVLMSDQVILLNDQRLMLLVVLILFFAIVIGLGMELFRLIKIKYYEIKDIMERDFEFDG